MWDFMCSVSQGITGWFRDLAKSGSESVMSFLAATVMGTPEIDSPEMARAAKLWGSSQTIANTCFVLIITVVGVLLMTGHSLPGELTVKDLLPRVLLAFLSANLSLVLIGYAISFANGLAAAFLSAGEQRIDPDRVGTLMSSSITATINTTGMFPILVTLVALVMAAMVAFIYVMRLAITMVLIAAAPIALMFHALPMTEGIARLWWRGITGMLAIQVCQALVFVTALQVLFTSTGSGDDHLWGIPSKADLIDLLLLNCLLYLMIRIPSWVARTIWQPAQPRMLTQAARSILMYYTFGAITRATRAGRAAGAAGPRRPKPGPGGGGRPKGPGPHPGSPGPANGPKTQPPGGGPRPSNAERKSGMQPKRRPVGDKRPHRYNRRRPGNHRSRPGRRPPPPGSPIKPGRPAPRRGGPAGGGTPQSNTRTVPVRPVRPSWSRSATAPVFPGARRTVPQRRTPAPARQATLRLVPPRRKGGRR
ncbi:hypothetical protein [Actinomadura sp. B10D3]|uniref:hypothetical protein n=1 Tax=Actinomadura sp. B10D3 TaxID=3153557 RepID=UPI00325CA5A1